MVLCRGNILEYLRYSDHFLFTGNSYINSKKELVMGRGLALQVRCKWPFVAKRLGVLIEHLSIYGLLLDAADICLDNGKHLGIGVLQVKIHYLECANPFIIEDSINILKRHAEKKINERFDINFPGIGAGRLGRSRVLPLIKSLPDNVHVWEY